MGNILHKISGKKKIIKTGKNGRVTSVTKRSQTLF